MASELSVRTLLRTTSVRTSASAYTVMVSVNLVCALTSALTRAALTFTAASHLEFAPGPRRTGVPGSPGGRQQVRHGPVQIYTPRGCQQLPDSAAALLWLGRGVC